MFQAMRACSVLLFFAYALSSVQTVRAQIAPTTTATLSGSVSDSSGNSVSGATVRLQGPKNASTHTDARGLFVFIGVPFGTYQVFVSADSLGTVLRTLPVEGDVNVAIQYERASPNDLKTIAQVHSSAQASFNITPASVTQVSPVQNAFEGQTSWRTILEQIPGVAQAGLNNGSNVNAAMPDSPVVPMKISIDGALPYETATLLDDMPLIGGSFQVDGYAGTGTDLSSYPLNSFSSADVIRGPGANAPSIVNSIGGSFMLHSPGIVDRDHYTLALSTDPYGGIVANAQAAIRMRKLSTVLTYGVWNSPGPFTGSGIPNRTIFNPSSVDGQAFSPYSPPCVAPSCIYGSSLVDPNYSGTTFYGNQTGLLVCCANQSTASSQHSGSIALTYAFSPSLTMSVFYAGEISNAVDPEPYCVTDFLPPSGYSGSIAPGQYLFNKTNFTFSPQGMSLQKGSSLVEEKITAQLGRGVLRLAALQNRTYVNVALDVPGSLNNVQLYGGGCIASTTTSPGCPAGQATITFNGGSHTLGLPLSLAEYSPGWNNNRDLLLSYTTPLGEAMHAGVSFVQSYYNSPFDISCFINTMPAFSYTQPSSISETTNELRVFAGGNLSDKVSFDLSTYFVNAQYHVPNPNGGNGNYVFVPPAECLFTQPSAYSDARYSYAAPRLGIVWRPTAAVAIRAAAGGGFAEAPLNDLVGSSGVAQINSISSPQYYSVTSENLNLQPEKSFAFDLGADIRMRRETVLSFDIYRSNVYGQVYNATLQNGTYTGAYGTLPLYQSQYGNIGESRYEGILLDVRHDVPRGIYWSASGGLTRGYVVSVPAGFYNTGSCQNCTNLYIVPGVNFNGELSYVGVAIPYAQGLGTIGYRWSPEKDMDLTATYYGNNNTYFRPAFVELNAHLQYPLTKNISLLMTFENITGVYDGSVQVYSPANFSGAPAISGAPFPLYGEMYGPRTVILTTNLRL